MNPIGEYPVTEDLQEARAAAAAGARTSGDTWAVFYRGHREGPWRDLWAAAPAATPDDRGPCELYQPDGARYMVTIV